MPPLGSLTPSFSSPPILCHQLKARLELGTYVQIRTNGQDTKPLVCCLLKGGRGNLVTVNVLGYFSDFTLEDARPLTNDARLRHLPELVQTETTRVVSSNQITEVAFVLTEDYLKNTHSLQGTLNVFLLRYQEDGSPVKCVPFPSLHGDCPTSDCYASRLWYNMELFRTEISRKLGTERQQQGTRGCKANGQFAVTRDFWEFVKRNLSVVVMSSDSRVYKPKSKRLKRVMDPGGKLCTERIDNSSTTEFIRLETHDELQKLVNVFGEGILCERRKRRPAVNNSIILNQNDALNVILSESDNAAGVFLKRTQDNGIDLKFDGHHALSFAWENIVARLSMTVIWVCKKGLLREWTQSANVVDLETSHHVTQML